MTTNTRVLLAILAVAAMGAAPTPPKTIENIPVGPCVATLGGLPDPGCTPGYRDPRLTRARLCSSAFHTSTVRPSTSVTGPAERATMVAYGYEGRRAATFEYDHLIPLSLGGASDGRNLWPELYKGRRGAYVKDGVERRLANAVCDGEMGLRAAQRVIATDWTVVLLPGE